MELALSWQEPAVEDGFAQRVERCSQQRERREEDYKALDYWG